MLRGFITTKHIILHPITLISAWGIRGYVKMLFGCMDDAKHCFTDFMML